MLFICSHRMFIQQLIRQWQAHRQKRFTWLFRLTQDYYNYKMASAIGIIVFIICAVFTLVAFNRMIKGDKEGTYQ